MGARRLEIIIALLGAIFTFILLGGFAVVIAQMNEAEFLAGLYPAMQEIGMQVPQDEAYVVAKTLAAWFGFTVFFTLILTAIGVFFARLPKRWRRSGVIFAITGVVCLIGSQLIAYPVAFFFFLAAALMFLRKVEVPEDPIAQAGKQA